LTLALLGMEQSPAVRIGPGGGIDCGFDRSFTIYVNLRIELIEMVEERSDRSGSQARRPVRAIVFGSNASIQIGGRSR
jgi:hypothetical protein